MSGLSSGLGYGPFRMMAETDIGKNETFVGRNIENIVMDLAFRASHNTGSIEVIGGQKYQLPPGESFPFDTKCLDVLNTVLEKAGFVAADIPGGKRIVMPRPNPSTSQKFVAEYRPDTYMSLSVEPINAVTYHSVVVYRVGTATSNAVFAERECDPRAPESRRFIIADFPGTQAEADQLAFDTAMQLRSGERTFSMTTFFNPDINLWDGFKAVRIKRKDGKWWKFSYNCTVNTSITIAYSPGESTMEVSGTCFELVNEREVLDSREKNAVSGGVVRSNDYETDIAMGDTFILQDSTVMNKTS